MDLTEAVSFALLKDLLKQLVPSGLYEVIESRFTDANGLLGAVSGNSFSRWRELMRYVPAELPSQPPDVPSDVLEAVQAALIERRALRVGYCRIGATEPQERLLHPLALLQRDSRSHLIARAYDFAKPRSYALHRIRGAKVLDQPARRPHGFSLDSYLVAGKGEFREGEPIVFRARVRNRMAEILEESRISEQQKITRLDDDWHLFTASLRDTWQLEFWILSWSLYLEVLEPAELRDRIQSRLKDALDGYGGS